MEHSQHASVLSPEAAQLLTQLMQNLSGGQGAKHLADLKAYLDGTLPPLQTTDGETLTVTLPPAGHFSDLETLCDPMALSLYRARSEATKGGTTLTLRAVQGLELPDTCKTNAKELYGLARAWYGVTPLPDYAIPAIVKLFRGGAFGLVRSFVLCNRPHDEGLLYVHWIEGAVVLSRVQLGFEEWEDKIDEYDLLLFVAT